MGNAVSYDFVFVYFLYLIIILGIIGFAIYFMISTLRFFQQKTKNDRELLAKLDELISFKKRQADQKTDDRG